MANISGTYNFQSVQVELLIRDAYENISISPEFITPQKLESARRSINLILLEWMNKSTNLWTLQSDFLSLNEFQSSYNLPNYVSDLTEVNLRTSTRVLGGTPASSSGDAGDSFDGDKTTSCTQNAPNGNISYDYGQANAQNIKFVGILSNANSKYSLTIEYSQDNINWKELQVIESQSYFIGITKWLDILKPLTARAYRIIEKAGATLDIQEIYFNNNVLDTVISSISRNEYLGLPEKNITGRPSVYYFDRTIIPAISIWPTPSALYNVIGYSYKKMMQDVGLYTNTIEIPSRFYPALVAALSFKLSLKFNNEIADMLNQEYQDSFSLATIEDSENNIISVIPEWQNSKY